MPPPASASAAGETCQGRPATIVGTGPDVVGTPGDDVIVSGTSIFVNADAGNDLICITGPNFVHTDAGPGDDVVDASVTTAVDPETSTSTELGTGHDRFLGSPFNDGVFSDGADDEVFTGLGADKMVITITGMPTGALGSYDGGDGPARHDDIIYLESAAFDLEVGLDESIVVDGMPAATLTGFAGASLTARRVVLRGNASRNVLMATACEIQIAGNGGNDSITNMNGFERFACASADRTTSLTGGGGDDTIHGGPGHLRLSGGGGDDRLFGHEGADRLVGGAGNDILQGDDGADRLMGGSGNDRMRGDKGADRLVGGAGHDRADGGRGRDTCDAEIVLDRGVPLVGPH